MISCDLSSDDRAKASLVSPVRLATFAPLIRWLSFCFCCIASGVVLARKTTFLPL